MTLSSKLEPTIWSHDTGQQIQVSIDNNISNVKDVHYKTRLHVAVNLLARVWPPSCASHHAYTPTTNTASNQKMNLWVSFIFLYGCGALLGGPRSCAIKWQSRYNVKVVNSTSRPKIVLIFKVTNSIFGVLCSAYRLLSQRQSCQCVCHFEDEKTRDRSSLAGRLGTSNSKLLCRLCIKLQLFSLCWENFEELSVTN